MAAPDYDDDYLNTPSSSRSSVSNTTSSTSPASYYYYTDEIDIDYPNTPLLILNRHCKPVVIALGLAGNALVVTALLGRTSRLRHCSAGHLLAAVCLSDAVFLAGSVPMWFAQQYGVGSPGDLYNRDGLCEFLSLVTLTSNFLSTWYTVAVVCERFLTQYCLRRLNDSSNTPRDRKNIVSTQLNSFKVRTTL